MLSRDSRIWVLHHDDGRYETKVVGKFESVIPPESPRFPRYWKGIPYSACYVAEDDAIYWHRRGGKSWEVDIPEDVRAEIKARIFLVK